MTEFLMHVWKQDPLLVFTGGLILGLLFYIEVLRLRIQMVSSVFSALGNGGRGNGGEEEGVGCLALLLMLLLLGIAILLAAIFVVTPG